MVVYAKDGKEVQVDLSPTVIEETSPEPTGTSPATYTEEQVKERETKVRSDALADLGRIKQESERSNRIAQDALARLEAKEKAQQDAEIEAAQDDPAELRRIKAEQEAARLKSELAQRDAELNSSKEKLSTYEKTLAEQTKVNTAHEVAKRLGVDSEKLSRLVKFTDGSVSAIEEIASELPRSTVKNNLKPDSNRSQGGNITDAAIIAAYSKNPYDFGNRERYLELRRRRGE